jgi:type VI secretion system protein ImpA
MPSISQSHATPLAVDLDALLSPIAADEPAGPWLRYDPIYDTIKELRRSDDPTLPQGVWKRPVKRADWDRVASLCAELLETRCKDLQLAGWLLEAWLHLHGFVGVDLGLRVIAGLCQDFWPDVHPRPEGWPERADEAPESGELDIRLAPLLWMVDSMALALKTVPITRPEREDVPACSWADWESALHTATQIERGLLDAPPPPDRVSQAKFLLSTSMTPTGILVRSAGEVEQCMDAAWALSRLLDARCGREAPSLAPILDVLETVHGFLARTLEERVPAVAAGADACMSEDALDAPGAMPFASAPGRITSRAEAYRRLDEAAEYLLQTEPHSPAPYLVKRAIAWGNMTLAELLPELLQSGTDIRAVYTLLGIHTGGKR